MPFSRSPQIVVGTGQRSSSETRRYRRNWRSRGFLGCRKWCTGGIRRGNFHWGTWSQLVRRGPGQLETISHAPQHFEGECQGVSGLSLNVTSSSISVLRRAREESCKSRSDNIRLIINCNPPWLELWWRQTRDCLLKIIHVTLLILQKSMQQQGQVMFDNELSRIGYCRALICRTLLVHCRRNRHCSSSLDATGVQSEVNRIRHGDRWIYFDRSETERRLPGRCYWGRLAASENLGPEDQKRSKDRRKEAMEGNNLALLTVFVAT